ncbi:MAG: helix-turn-helix domain-containing protein [Clostridia bacterium]|nr:helix-turn-helix domain-containing protein [Clostridia bacterium]MBR4954377.1 helix-turn-helix domain-containing protein [Clostridia bacterium]MBR5903843.1 helix-turn-helix domain-containing protein [Clostridia bacterium]
MRKNIRDENLDKLFEAILSLETVDECYALFDDLCTVNELIALKQRFLVARMLSEGMIYSEIVEKTGVSTATISRINRCLNYGEGYVTALERINKK